jgi:hypothetical protein
MEPEANLQYSQDPANGPYPEPVQYLPPYFFTIHFNIILPSMPMSSKWSHPFRYSDLK